MKQVMGSLIHPTQSAFVEGRQIMDCILIANEVIDSIQKKSKGGLVFKLDFEKVFDSVDWDFHVSIMKQTSFRNKWTRWILGCISSASISMLINGSPTNPIVMQRGLSAVSVGILHGIKMSCKNLQISHLQFADDIIIFYQPLEEQLLMIKRILRCFLIISGLKENFKKSALLGIKVDHQLIKKWASKIHCKVSIPSWKRTLIKSVLANLPYSQKFIRENLCYATKQERNENRFWLLGRVKLGLEDCFKTGTLRLAGWRVEAIIGAPKFIHVISTCH
ncbi:uncharacterized protein LOC111284330 [Durio zibethinus]|uniref:Uncharacterized protein LOC111284330 n=1 Tax=Durio zibethinus TaxID=66656 RepID=A0A6P5XK47_DURZI|nr:uncharacterized protein LOC111284330 [Durio zibethinus]